MRKNLIIVLLIFVVILFGCQKENRDIKIFNSDVARQKALEYMFKMKIGDIEGANEISTKELATKEDLGNNEMSVVSYTVDRISELKDGAYVEMKVVKTQSEGAKCTLDKWVLKVEKESESYKISEIKSTNKQQVVSDGNSLDIIDAEASYKEKITNLNDLPDTLYPKGQEPMIDVQQIPKQSYQTVGISLDSNKIAFSTTDGKNCFIAVALMEHARPAAASGGGQQIAPRDLEKILEKPLAQKIVYCDILPNAKISNFVFTEESNALIVQYIEGNNSKGLKIYTMPGGDLLDLKLDKIFPLDKYNVEYVASVKSNILINVKKKEGVNGINQNILGEYIVDVEKEEVDKL